ncbi:MULTISPECIES: GAF domain-containing protein [unclassified Nocardia]|uniref:GAF domain-containing protein n=1 Tax=unclassified Nocardia TaxID=2637762 RepID=UPI00278C3F8F|nr:MULTISPECIES: GAF domain-containing protein [unclassified Nocardia]
MAKPQRRSVPGRVVTGTEPRQRRRAPTSNRPASRKPAPSPTDDIRARAQPEPDSAGQSERGWVVVETLTGTADQVTLFLNYDRPHAFSSLARANLPSSVLESLVKQSFESGKTYDKVVTRSNGRLFRLVAIPIHGPSGAIHAIAVWSASVLEPPPPIPVIGAVEWTPSGLLSTNPAGEYLLEPPFEVPGGRTIPELLSGFNRWDDRDDFLEMFNFRDTPAERWSGRAAKVCEDDTLRQFHLAARTVGTGDARVVRGVVCDVTSADPSHKADMAVEMLRAMPIEHGHALALVDLKSAFVHEWLTEDHSPLAGWRHHHPLYDTDGRDRVAITCYELAAGLREHATTDVRVRFNPGDEWTDITGEWTRLPYSKRPQAMLDITPTSPNPPPPVPECRYCYEITNT